MLIWRSLLLAFVSLMSFMTAHAQDSAPSETASALVYGTHVTGKLDDRTPREVFTFDGLRCEVVAVRLRATGGDLDPVLMVLDSSGQAVASRDDTQGGRDALEEAVRIPKSDHYYVVAGRFGFGLGTTAGDYELDIERIGVSSASGCTLRYGDSIPNTITDDEPQFFYAFQAQRGDILNVEMQRMSGNLDPYLQVVNSQAFVIADNDDWQDTRNARIPNLLIEETGAYIIVASRYGQASGTSTGSFVLTLEEAENSGLGNSVQAAVPMEFGESVQDTLTDDQPVKYFTFEARRDDLVTVTMERDGGRLDAYLKLANAGLQELAADDDGGGGKNAKLSEYLIPADGVYYILATRYEGPDAPPTIGRFKLTLTSQGNAFDGVPQDIQHITYGTTVTGRIDDLTPQALYAFWGVEGDLITLAMNRGDGNLDPVVSVLNAESRPLVSDDDGGGEQNARIDRYKIPSTGVYYIRATRYAGSEAPNNTEGSYIVVLARRFD